MSPNRKFVGIWKSSEEDDLGAVSHYVLIRKEDGEGLCKSMEVLKTRGIYFLKEEAYQWRVVGDHLIENYEMGTPEESVSVYNKFTILSRKFPTMFP